MTSKHLGIILLTVINAFGLYSILAAYPSTLIVKAYFISYFLASIVLFFLSLSGYKREKNWQKSLDTLGIIVSVGSVVVTLGYFILLAWS